MCGDIIYLSPQNNKLMGNTNRKSKVKHEPKEIERLQQKCQCTEDARRKAEETAEMANERYQNLLCTREGKTGVQPARKPSLSRYLPPPLFLPSEEYSQPPSAH